MEITFLGATHEVTGSCTLLSVGGRHIMIDCGMEQGRDVFVNQDLPVRPQEVDCVVLTHAHIDHSGKLPLLYRQGFRGQIYATEATTSLCEIMLRDSAHIQEMEAEWKNRKGQRSGKKPVEPMYTVDDAEAVMKHFVPYPYEKRFQAAEGVEVIFRDVGHLLGSACVKFFLTENGEERTIVFSGDIGNKDKPILKDPAAFDEADYVVMESTYGDRYHEKPQDHADTVEQLAAAIEHTLARGGNVVIPSFAVGRTQELLYYIREIKQRGLVSCNPNFKVYIDSPLAHEATGIFVQTDPDYFDEDLQAVLASGQNPIFFPGLEVAVSAEESRAINFDTEPKVILSASGMCEAGRIRHHLKHNLWRKESLILFAGYQANGTLGRVIFEGAEKVMLFGEEIQVNAEVSYLANISGHADKQGLTDWICSFEKKPDLVFINHGEDAVTASYAEYLMDECGFKRAVAPFSGTVYDLISGSAVVLTEGVPVEAPKSAAKVEGLYRTLVETGKRLMLLIETFRGRTNRDVRKLTRDIDSVIEKWED